MFNLIISIIAIALVVVLAGASLYYGGDAFNKGSEEARASTFINQAQQIQAAATLFKASNGAVPTMTDLKDGYLAGEPKLAAGKDTEVWGVDTTSKAVFVKQAIAQSTADGITKGICDTINKNGSGVVFCVKAADVAAAVAAVDALTAGELPDVTGAVDVVTLMKL
ncbi:hypothetical protein D3C87_351860 [compost metagenome]